MARSTAQRDRDRAAIRRTEAACGICGQAIDYDLPYLDLGSFVVDHIVPVAAGGRDDLSNKQAAHRACNRAKGASTDGGKVIKRSGSLARPSFGGGNASHQGRLGTTQGKSASDGAG